MGGIADECNLDVNNGELERALHRVVRAMHDGHCPNCGHLAPSYAFVSGKDHKCPNCGFSVTQEEANEALRMFHPFMKKSVDLFNEWREKRKTGNVSGLPVRLDSRESIVGSLSDCGDGSDLWIPGEA